MSNEKELKEMYEALGYVQAAINDVSRAWNSIERRPRWPEIVNDLKVIQTALNAAHRDIVLAGRRERRELDKIARAEKCT